MLKLNYIAEYVTLAETLNFSKTAERMYITQPALSRHISVIEEEMGAMLFERDTKNVHITPAGQAVCDSFRSILGTYKQAQEQAALLSSGKSGVLKISSPYYWAEDYVDPVILAFSKAYPLVDIKVYSCQPPEAYYNVCNNQTDIAMLHGLKDIDEYIRKYSFTTEKNACIMSADHPLASRSSLKLEELYDESFIILDTDKVYGTDTYSAAAESLQKLTSKRGFVPKKVLLTQQVDTVGMTISQTGGVSILPYGLRNMNRNYIKTIPLEDADCEINMCFYYRTDNPNPAIQLFMQCVKDVFPKQPK